MISDELHDLLSLLEDGHLRGAFLDVFQQEPLQNESALWHHPAVKMTPHMAGVLMPQSCAPQVSRNISRLEAGEALPDLLDLSLGY